MERMLSALALWPAAIAFCAKRCRAKNDPRGIEDGAAAGVGGGVHEHVDAAHGLSRRIDHGENAVGVAHLDGDAMHLRPLRAQAFGCGL